MTQLALKVALEPFPLRDATWLRLIVPLEVCAESEDLTRVNVSIPQAKEPHTLLLLTEGEDTRSQQVRMEKVEPAGTL
jgi:hypothetical protein